MYVEDLDIPQERFSHAAQRLIDRAVVESRRRAHATLTSEHLFLAFAQSEWTLFAELMRDVQLNPYTVLEAIEAHLRAVPPDGDGELRVTPTAKLICRLALHRASRAGRQAIDAADVFTALLEETQNVPVSILRQQGVEPDVLVFRLTAGCASWSCATSS